VDFLLIEYNNSIPVAVVDYKHHQSSVALNQQRPNLRALGGLYNAQGQQLPFIVAYYNPQTWDIEATP
jgi:hypothetical protein